MIDPNPEFFYRESWVTSYSTKILKIFFLLVLISDKLHFSCILCSSLNSLQAFLELSNPCNNCILYLLTFFVLFSTGSYLCIFFYHWYIIYFLVFRLLLHFIRFPFHTCRCSVPFIYTSFPVKLSINRKDNTP